MGFFRWLRSVRDWLGNRVNGHRDLCAVWINGVRTYRSGYILFLLTMFVAALLLAVVHFVSETINQRKKQEDKTRR